MGNISGNAYALTILSPLKNELVGNEEISCADKVRDILLDWNDPNKNSPMAQVAQTYLCRFFVLDDVYSESLPGGGALDTLSDLSPYIPDFVRRWVLPREEHLKSKYLVFCCNFHCGSARSVDLYLKGMWTAISNEINKVWVHCYGFDAVTDAASFVCYMKKCQLKTSLFFVGSNDEPLPEQLKALYLKQEFARFAADNQGLEAAVLRANYQAFIQRVAPAALGAPTWEQGKYRV